MAAPLVSDLVRDLKRAEDPSAQIQRLCEYEPRMDVISGLLGELSGDCSESESRNLYIGLLELLGLDELEIEDPGLKGNILKCLSTMRCDLPRYKHYRAFVEAWIKCCPDTRYVSDGSEVSQLCSIMTNLVNGDVGREFSTSLSLISDDMHAERWTPTRLIAFQYIWKFIGSFARMEDRYRVEFDDFGGMETVETMVLGLLAQKETLYVEFGLHILNTFMAAIQENLPVLAVVLAANCQQAIRSLMTRPAEQKEIFISEVLRFVSLIPPHDVRSGSNFTSDRQLSLFLPEILLEYPSSEFVRSFMSARSGCPRLITILQWMSLEKRRSLLELICKVEELRTPEMVRVIFTEEFGVKEPQIALDSLQYAVQQGLSTRETVSYLAETLVTMSRKEFVDKDVTAQVLNSWGDFKAEVASVVERLAVMITNLELLEMINTYLGESQQRAANFLVLFANLASNTRITEGIRHLIYLYSGLREYPATDGPISIKELLATFVSNQREELRSYCNEKMDQCPRYCVILAGLTDNSQELEKAYKAGAQSDDLYSAVCVSHSTVDALQAIAHVASLATFRESKSLLNMLKSMFGDKTIRYDPNQVKRFFVCMKALSLCPWVTTEARFFEVYVTVSRQALEASHDFKQTVVDTTREVCQNVPEIPQILAELVMSDPSFASSSIYVVQKFEQAPEMLDVILSQYMIAISNHAYNPDRVSSFVAVLPPERDTANALFRAMINQNFTCKENVSRFAEAALRHACQYNAP